MFCWVMFGDFEPSRRPSEGERGAAAANPRFLICDVQMDMEKRFKNNRMGTFQEW